MSASEPAVVYEVRGAVAWLTINRPGNRNALSREVRDGLWAGYRRFAADKAVAVLVLTGAGDRVFCAGGDLNEVSGERLQLPPTDFIPTPASELINPSLGRNIAIDKPVIAAINGAAYAGGFLLAQACDLCVAAAHARFAVPEVKVGRGCGWAAPLPWLIPPRVALELLLTGEPIGADRAHEIGLVNSVVPAGELTAAAQGLAERIAANAPISVRRARQMVYATAGCSLEQALEIGHMICSEAYLSEDAQEGPKAFLEKRTPVWLGR